MRKMILFCECGVGTQSADAVLVDESLFDSNGNETPELEDTLWGYALDHASSYGIYPESEKPEDYDEEEVDCWRSDEYSDDIASWLEPYDPDKHDGLKGGGGDWEWDREI